MIAWINSQPLFIQIAAGIVTVMLGFGVLGLLIQSFFEGFSGGNSPRAVPKSLRSGTDNEVLLALIERYGEGKAQEFWKSCSQKEKQETAQNLGIHLVAGSK